MLRLTIDGRPLAVPEGTTVLRAARDLGLDIPALCFLEGHEPATSCMLCLVKIKGRPGFLPSCATLVLDGMEVESETEAVHRVRRTGLELLLTDHTGDCVAPCQSACPVHMDIPQMLRQVAAADWDAALVTVKDDIVLPATLGRVCHEPCERGCRRRQIDDPAAICQVKRAVADRDLARSDPYLPPRAPSTGKSVAIVGAGPSGLAAAYHLQRAGHSATLFEAADRAGGSLRDEIAAGRLPEAVLQGEIRIIERLGATIRCHTRVGADLPLAELREQHDAVLLAIGEIDEQQDELFGLAVRRGRLATGPDRHRIDQAGLFAAGKAVQPGIAYVRSVAHGKEAAVSIDRFLRSEPIPGRGKEFSSRAGRLDATALASMARGTRDGGRVRPADPITGLSEEEARAEAARCLHCDCGDKVSCRLRRYAQAYGASATRYGGGKRRRFERIARQGDVLFEPGKCIVCGLCVRVAAEAGEPLGLTFIGRGFDLRIGVPFGRDLDEGLRIAARRCVEVCPTGALFFRDGSGACHACRDCGR